MAIKSDLVLKQFRKETENYFSLIFNKPENFSFNAGDCVSLSFPNDLANEKKIFSFASSPSEENIIITVKYGFSNYKKRMEKMKPGDSIHAIQYGSYFTQDHRYDSIFIGGGVGVAPFRSMIKDSLEKKLNNNMLLVYLSHSNNFPFLNEFTMWDAEHSFFTLKQIATDQEGRITQELLEKLLPEGKRNQMCYVVGSPGLVDTMDEFLQYCGYTSDFIKTDSFDGYIQEA